ncbi:MAG: acyltransferase [Rhizobiales bacterium]|nr:acyltransferase [Hyphomicrobiales bacterium]
MAQYGSPGLASERMVALEGLRGVAALAVVLSHALFAFEPGLFKTVFPQMQATWPEMSWPLLPFQWPPLNALVNGSFSVCIFFVLSGLVLTRLYSQTGNPQVLISRAIRRVPRLAIPIAASIVFAYAIFACGLMRNLQVAPLTQSSWLAGYYPDSLGLGTALREASYGALLSGSALNSPLWTMPVELIGSYLAFAFAMKERWIGWPLFAIGSFIAIVLTGKANLPFYLCFAAGTQLGRLAPAAVPRLVKFAALPVGLYLGGFSDTAAYQLIIDALGGHVVPLQRSVHCLGAVCVVVAAISTVWLARCLSSRIPALLGRLSFAVYLLHFPITCSLGSAVYLTAIRWGHGAASTLAIATVMVATVAAAYPFHRYIDTGAMKFSRQVELALRRLIEPRRQSA